MNLEFHYWVVLFLARKAGLDSRESLLIARSSQFVDERSESLSIRGSDGAFTLPATQRIGLAGDGVSSSIWIPFHFVPGDATLAATARLDGASHPLATTENSSAAKSLLVAALKTGNPYRIGIALHAYADTWAHQNFVGDEDSFNAFFPDDSVPPIGHAPALNKPDLLGEVWEDPRLKPEFRLVENRRRFAAAARMIYKYLATYARRGFEDVDLVEAELQELWGKPGSKGRSERYADYAIELYEAPYRSDEWYLESGIPDASRSSTPGVGLASRIAGVLGGQRWSERAAKAASRGSDFLRETFGLPTRELRAPGPVLGSPLEKWAQAAGAHLREATALLGPLLDRP